VMSGRCASGRLGEGPPAGGGRFGRAGGGTAYAVLLRSEGEKGRKAGVVASKEEEGRTAGAVALRAGERWCGWRWWARRDGKGAAPCGRWFPNATQLLHWSVDRVGGGRPPTRDGKVNASPPY
jgi:hypothetical protein